MALKTFVKISDVSNLSDARYCAGMGVDVLGFRLDPDHHRAVDPAKFKSITEWVAGVGLAGEFYQSDPDTVVKTAAHYNLSYLQVRPDAVSEEVIELNIPLIIELELDEYPSIEHVKEHMIRHALHTEFFLVTASVEDPDIAILHDILKLSEEFPILLGCGIDKDSINDLLKSSRIKGIALKGGDELHPGFKDYDELSGIFEEIEVE